MKKTTKIMTFSSPTVTRSFFGSYHLGSFNPMAEHNPSANHQDQQTELEQMVK